MNIGSVIQNLTVGIHRHIDTQTTRQSLKSTFSSQSKESGLQLDHLSLTSSINSETNFTHYFIIYKMKYKMNIVLFRRR
jgi:hypothetical protein